MYLNSKRYKALIYTLSGGFSVGWAKAGMAILWDPDQKGMTGTHYPSGLHWPSHPKGFWPWTINDWDMGIFSKFGWFFFYLEAKTSHRTCIFHRNIVKIKYNMQKSARKKILENFFQKKCAQNFFYYSDLLTRKKWKQLCLLLFFSKIFLR